MAKELRSELRKILRHLRRWPSTSDRKGPYWQHIIEMYREPVTDDARLATVRRRSLNYATLLDSVAEFNRIRMLDTGAENVAGTQATLRKAAARAGLVLAEEEKHDPVSS
mmetsp:Transcript_3375/g.4711  ORF Transcript_3375/g.4711 Transcript_3375/m.4711 type:complete len:110 (+) Transcript_3375:67-396(+)